jgi:hypothetical protein
MNIMVTSIEAKASKLTIWETGERKGEGESEKGKGKTTERKGRTKIKGRGKTKREGKVERKGKGTIFVSNFTTRKPVDLQKEFKETLVNVS